MSATKADLERAKKVAEVDLSEWIDGENSKGYVCAISAGDVLKLPDEEDNKSNEAVYAWVISCFCGEGGELIFDGDDEARTFLAGRPFGMVQAICEKAMEVNGISEDGQQETEKN